MSEYPPGTPAGKHHFPARNRIVAWLSRAVIVAQAPQRSGALITADFALAEGRDLLVHEAGIDGPRGGGSRDLAEAGARVIRSAREMVAEWGWQVPGEPPRPASLAQAMEAELEGRGGEFNGVFFDASGRAVDG
jgi:DNA processing protein